MNKKVWIGFVVVFALMEIVGYLVDTVFLRSWYDAVQNVWRADSGSFVWIFHVIKVVGAYFFTYIFSKGYEDQGIAEGFRYGLYIGVWLSISMAYGFYAMIPIPYSLALRWFLYGVAEYIIYGIALAMVWGRKSRSPV